jgi:hypothetical protein
VGAGSVETAEIAVLADSIRGESALESRSLGLWSLTMHRFIDGEDRMQQTLLPNSLEDYVSEENPVRVIEVFIDELDLAALGFAGMTPAATGRPAYHPSTLLKIYLLYEEPEVKGADGQPAMTRVLTIMLADEW